MTLTTKYHMGKKIYESSKSIIFLGKNIETDEQVLIKILNSDYPDLEQVTRFKYEYELLKDNNIAGVPKTFETLNYKNSIALIRESFDGESLTEVNFSQYDILSTLEIFIKITQCISNVHKNNIIHKDINPSNILWNKDTNEVRIIDFGISTKLSQEKLEVENPSVLEGTLSYISPEQTGRINRPMDYRTDLYSLGITFYKLITGKLPFHSDDPMEMVHMHIAKTPEAPYLINKNIPKAVSDIILKLISKMSEDRYKSASGVVADLKFCVDEYKYTREIREFELGQNDFSEKFQISNKLYGRENEIKQILDSFDRVCKGSSELFVIAGYSGIGKTSLVYEIHKPLIEKRGYFISGKFDQFKRDIPYSALIQAFEELIRQILTESKSCNRHWRKEILEAVGDQGQVLINVIPELELIIGKQPKVQELNASEAFNRFNLLFRNFVKVFSHSDHPLVLFLDDLQWVDHASLNMLENLILDNEFKHLFIIGAYRDNEVDSTHPLTETLDKLNKSLAPISNLKLGELNEQSISEIIQENFPSKEINMKKLLEVCSKKTAGNPFFLKQFLLRLYEEKIISYNYLNNLWMYRIDKIENTKITENVVDLMTSRIQKLSNEAQKILKTASCVGSQFDLKTLSIVSEKNQAEISEYLWEILDEELIIPLTASYRYAKDLGEISSIPYKFFHDKIRQASYSMLDEEERKDTHLKTARLLSSHLLDEEKDEKIFELANHYNNANDLLSNSAELFVVAKLNLKAGIKAKNSGAYKPAFKLLANAIKLFDQKNWEENYTFSISLYSEAAEVCFLTADYDKMEEFSNIVITKGITPLDKIKAYESKINSAMANNKYSDGLLYARELLEELGLKLPKKADTVTILKTLIKTKLMLKDNNIERLEALPEMQDKKYIAIMKVLSNILSLCYVASPNLFPIVVLTQVQLSLKHGNTPSSAEAYALYGLILGGILKNYDSAYKVGKIALKLSEEKRYSFYRARVLFYTSNFVLHWKEKVADVMPVISASYNLALQNGDLEYAAWAAFLKCEYRLYSGIPLEEATDCFDHCEKTIKALKQNKQLTYTYAFQNILAVVTGKISKDEYYKKNNSLLDKFTEVNDSIGLYFSHFCNAIYQFTFGDYTTAYTSINNAEKYIESNLGSMNYPMFYFRQSLIFTVIYYEKKDKTILKKIQSNQKLMKKWSEHSPKNYMAKYLLIEAKLHEIKNSPQKAMENYTLAIKLAKENENLTDECIGNELAANYFFKMNHEKIAVLHLKEAHYSYKRLGAIEKVNSLEEKYPEFLLTNDIFVGTRTQSVSLSKQSSSTSSTINMLDLSSILKASQVLSGEIQLSSLLEKMMNYVIENAGAQKGYFILNLNKKLYIEAEIDPEQNKKEFLHSVPFNQNNNLLPSEIINFVMRTHEFIVLDDAVNEKKFMNSRYIQDKKPKSILCMPVINQNKLNGILYLENNLTKSAFSEDRIQMLNILTAQLAISLENATMYSELEKLNKTLEEKVNERTAELDRKNKKLTDSIDYAKRIQTIILPKSEKIAKQFSDHFIIYIPADIVSGDFYWFKQIENKKIFAVVDCTGHGVPGGFLAMIGNTLLDKIVHEKTELEPGKILERLHLEVRSTLRQAEGRDEFRTLKQLDGMDVALCVFEENSNKVLFAGAKRPLYHIKYSNDTKELIRLKGDKKSIGGRQKESFRTFTTQEITLDNRDTLYMTSDGYSDQNNISNKMIGTKRFERLLLEVADYPLNQQKSKLLHELNSHMGEEKQRDDITVVGLKIK